MIFIAILLVGGSFFFAEYRNKKAKNIYSANTKNDSIALASDAIPNSAKDVDTDGDGSKDWEEILLGTNPNDPKSKPSPIKEPTTKDLTKSDTKEKLSQIDLVSRDFFARYMELRQIGSSKDKFSQEELVRSTASGIVLSSPTEYKISEIIVNEDSSKESVLKYSQEISNIFKKYAIQSRNEAVITKESFEKENPDILKEIDPIIQSYKNIINSLIKVSAPSSIKILHLELVNSINGGLFIAQSFRSSAVDGIKGLQAISSYQISEQRLFNSIKALQSYFKYIGINENIF